MLRRLIPVAVVLAFGGCELRSPAAPDPAASVSRAGPPALGVMTWNVYVGADLGRLLVVEDPNDIPLEVAFLFADVIASDWPARAGAIVDQIELVDPHLIGLQEVMLFRVQSPGDFLIGNPTPATTPVVDFLDVLADALAARGLDYVPTTISQNFDIELPMVNFGTGGLDDVRATEFDVVLVRGDVAWSNPQHANFAAVLPLDVGGVVLPKPSGWASIDLTFKGLPYRFVTTHLEPADLAPGVLDPDLVLLQAAQAAELLQVLDQSPYPVILTGDLNSDDDGSTTATYADVRSSGFVDSWLVGPPRGEGYTSGQDIFDPEPGFYHRIDYVFYRDDFTRAKGRFQGSIAADRVGEDPADRTPGGIWPSDHAGVVAELTVAPGRGHPR